MVLRVAVLGGGNSNEAEISRSSASQISIALKGAFDTRYIELTSRIALDLHEFQPDIVFPVFHGPPGEDGTIQGLLEILEYPYVGCGVRASSLSMDKYLSKQQFRTVELPVLDDIIVNRDNFRSKLEEINSRFSNKVAIKPRFQGSALGVSLLPNGGNVRSALSEAFRFDEYVVVEPFIKGREITVGVLDLHGQDPIALPVTEITVAENEWYDFVNRYTPGRSQHVIPADVDPPVYAALQAAAVSAHQVLGCRDLCRADFVLEPDGSFWILEVNSMPGMTPTSLYPDACRNIGMDLPELVAKFVESASDRGLRND